MICRVLVILVVVTVCLLPSFTEAARPAQIGGAYLLEVCESDSNGKEKVKGGHAVCQAYIAGVIDYHNTLRASGLAPEVGICPPANVGLNTMHRVVLDYLRRNTQHDSFVAAPAVTLALHHAFPCE